MTILNHAAGSRAVHQGYQEHRGGHPEDSEESERPNGHQGVGHWPGRARPLGSGGRQTDPTE